MIGYGVAATCFAGLGITLVIRRESGILKRIRSTPLPAPTYLLAVLGSTFLVFLIEAALIIACGRLFFSVAVTARFLSLLAVLAIGAACFAAMGLGITTVVRTAEGSLGRDQRDLPADGDHLRDVLHAEGLPGVPARDRRGAAAHLLHRADPRRDGARRPHLVAPRRGRGRRASGARSGSRRRSAASAGSPSRAESYPRGRPALVPAAARPTARGRGPRSPRVATATPAPTSSSRAQVRPPLVIRKSKPTTTATVRRVLLFARPSRP